MNRLLLPLAALWIAAPLASGQDATPPNYGNSSGPPVPSSAPGATDAAGTGTDSSLGVTHAVSSGAARNGADTHANSMPQPENYGNSSGAPRQAPPPPPTFHNGFSQ